jgi:hypothetical protein
VTRIRSISPDDLPVFTAAGDEAAFAALTEPFRRQLREGANDPLYGGWLIILSGLLTTPGSLMYAPRRVT